MEPFLYQTVHLFGGRARMLKEHVARLHVASCEIFGRPYRPDLKLIEERLLAEVARARYPDAVSSFVRIELFDTGEEHIYGVGTSLYAGYALRSVRPEVYALRYDLPIETESVASLSAHLVAQSLAREKGCDEAVRIDRDGVVRSMGEGSVFGFREGVLIAPKQLHTATDVAVWETARAARMPAVQHSILRAELSLYDELFVADHRGLTSISKLDGKPFMALRVERLAEELEQWINRQ
ncbi:MAG: aminotransferase class IV [Alistipes sp.]|nr:aminotransferase class IV [Alistipes sp.]